MRDILKIASIRRQIFFVIAKNRKNRIILMLHKFLVLGYWNVWIEIICMHIYVCNR